MPNSERVLVADDDEDDLKFLRDTLREDGFQVDAVDSGLKACELLEQAKFDLVITDLVMPGATGFDVLRTARKSNPDFIGIALTSFGSLDSALDALNLGAYSYLLKPCEPATFRHCVQKGLEKQRLTKELFMRNQELQALNRDLDSKVQEATQELRILNQRVLNEMAGLKDLSELKTAFLNTVSHDLRNPISTIQGYIGFIMDDPPAGMTEQGRTCLVNIHKASEHMNYLIKQLLEAAQLTSRQMKLQWQTFPVSEIIAESLAMFRPQAEGGGITLKSRTDGDPRLVLRADRGRLMQILGNLMGNACKFTPRGGAVTVSARRDGTLAHFCVEDTGPGIAPQHQKRIFEKFYQVDSSLSRPFKGLGLGLRIAKDLVDLHGGRLWLESEPGKGSRFHVELPLAGGEEKKDVTMT